MSNAARSNRLAKVSGALLAVACAALPIAAQAADPEGKYVVHGLGNESCMTYLTAIANPAESSRHISWVMGYVSARNSLESQTFDIIPTTEGLDFAKVTAVICRSNGAMTLEKAAAQAVVALRPLRLAAESPLVVLSFQGRTARIRSGALTMLQTALIQKKFFRGAVDGNPTPDLYKAIKDFQEKEKIQISGLPDIDTFIRAIIKR